MSGSASATDNNTDLNQWWEKSGGSDLLGGKASWQEFFSSLPDHEKAFIDHDAARYFGCMDEGDEGRSGWQADKIGLGGAAFDYTRTVVDFRPLMHLLVGTSSHRRGCGYAAIIKQEKNLVDETTNQVADDQAKITAEKLEIPYLGVVEDYDMKRPDFHIARALYYDAGGYFIPYKLTELPKGFLITRGLVSDVEYGKKLAKVAIKIALGDHGFGHKFSAEAPFYLLVITEPGQGVIKEIATQELTEVIEELNQELGEQFNGQLPVKIDCLNKESA